MEMSCRSGQLIEKFGYGRARAFRFSGEPSQWLTPIGPMPIFALVDVPPG